MKKLLQLLRSVPRRVWQQLKGIPYGEIFMQVVDFVGGVLHRALFTVLLPKRYRSLTKQQIFTIIFKSDTPAGKRFDIYLLVAIALNILVIILESLEGTSHWFAVAMRVIGWGFTLLFTFEYYLRIYCLKRPARYLFSFYGIIDFLSIAPAYLSLFFPAMSSLSVLRLMRMLRVFRIFKMQRFLDESHFLMNALRRSAVKILIFMLFVFLTAVVLGAVMYGLEGRANAQLNSIPKGVYWAVVTITTVGYGDISPVTPMGQWISMLVMLLGYSIIAVPTGIVAGETIDEHRRQRAKKGSRRRPSELKEDPSEVWNEPVNDDDPGARAKDEDLM